MSSFQSSSEVFQDRLEHAETSSPRPSRLNGQLSTGPAFQPRHRAVLGGEAGTEPLAKRSRTSANVVHTTKGTPSARQMAGRSFFAKTTSAYSAPYRSVWPSPTKATGPHRSRYRWTIDILHVPHAVHRGCPCATANPVTARGEDETAFVCTGPPCTPAAWSMGTT